MRRVVLGLSALVLMSQAAWAAGTDGGEKTNLFAGDVGNALWTLVIFLAVIFVLGKFAWTPLLGAMQQREQFIRDSLTQAKEDREKAEATLAEYTAKLTEARTEATAIVEEGRRDAQAVQARIQEEARTEAEKMIERARREIDLAKGSALKELYARSANLATQIASQVIGREISAADHERLIADAIDKVSDSELN